MSCLELSKYITLDKNTIDSPNLCDRFDEEDLRKIGNWCFDSYYRDRQSRQRWYKRTEGALELAMQVQKDKTFPWQNCSNIIFPLVTIAALQFHARAYPTIVSGKRVVKCQVIGPDPEQIEQPRADRISDHMSWQLLEQDECWEEEQDKALLNVAIVGCGFKKSYYDAGLGHNVSTYVHAKDLVFDYWAKSIDSAQTKTHIIPMFRNEIYSRCKAGVFSDILNEPWYEADATPRQNDFQGQQDDRDGTEQPVPDHDTPFTMLEQHCWLDLDGDGYAEPYIVTFEEASQVVVRIVARFDREEDIDRTKDGSIIRIRAWEYFTKLPFIPAPDGSAMDIGFGVLLGPLNESVNAAINQLFDAGTLANTAGGFLGRGAKIRGGVYEFAPFSWNRVDSTGDDLRKSIYPLPVREPSNVMFQLLGLIIDYSNRVSGTTEINVGENIGQNTPAETARNMSEQGQKIYTAIYKRIWRGMKREFQKLYRLNSVFLSTQFRYGAGGAVISREDYTGSASGVVPVADPNIASEAMRYSRAAALKQLSMGNPAYNADAVEVEVIRSLGVQDPETYYKGVENAPPPQPDVKLQVQQMKTQEGMARLELEKQKFVATLQETARMNSKKMEVMTAQVFKLMEDGKNVEAKQRIDAFRASMEMIREQNKSLDSQIKSLMEIGRNELESRSTFGAGAVPGMEGASGDLGSVQAPGIQSPAAPTGLGAGSF